MKLTFKNLRALAKESFSSWNDDYAPSMGAALAYYTMFSIAPLLVIVIAVAGLVFGAEAVQGQIVGQLGSLIGHEGAVAIEGLIKSANEPAKGLIATVVGVLLLVVGATTVFAELQSALDRIWRTPAPEKKGNAIVRLLRTRLLSFGMILGLGFLSLVSLVMGTALAAFGTWFGGMFKGWETLLQIVNIVISFVFTTGLFGMIYKLMPRARIAWRDVWVGAIVTSVLFVIGKLLIGLYLGKSSVTSGFGAAGSLVVLLLWVYYSSQIFLLGAEFTWAFARLHGSMVGKPIPPRVGEVPTKTETEAVLEGATPPADPKQPATNPTPTEPELQPGRNAGGHGVLLPVHRTSWR